MQRIFEDDEDCQSFCDHLNRAKDDSQASLLAFCLLGNHVHLVIESGDEPLGNTIKRLSSRYVRWFNLKYERCGHLFQERYKSEAIESETYLVSVLRYVYNNPLKAGLCERAFDYPWSSYRLLGSANELINEARLAELCDIECLRLFADQEQGVILDIDNPKNRKTDAAIQEVMQKASGARTASAFQGLGKDQQKNAVRSMLDDGASIRQASRITGLSKGLIESWARTAKQNRNSGL